MPAKTATTQMQKEGDQNYAPPGKQQHNAAGVIYDSTLGPPSLPPDVWTQKMLQVWKTALEEAGKDGKLVTIDDFAKHGEQEESVKLNSPRSIQACLQLGIDPSEIAFRPVEAFHERRLNKELQDLKFEHNEKIRKEKIQKLQAERMKIIQQEEEEEDHQKATAAAAAANTTSSGKYKCPKDFQEQETLRLNVMRRRQQRELEQMAKYEAARQTSLASIFKQVLAENQARAEAERKAEEQKRTEKAKKDKEWQAELRKRELEKLKEEEALEKKSKQLASERYMHEQEQLVQEQRLLKQQRKEAMRKEQERAAKQEEFRRQMEKIQEAQQEVLRKKVEEMQQKENERRRLLDEQNKERVRQHMEARKHAEERHANAVANFHGLVRKREEDYLKRQELLSIKMKKQEEEQKRLEAEKKRRDEAREQQRLEVIREAQAERERRIKELLQKAEVADSVLQNFIMKRQLEHTRRVLETQLEFEEKHSRAESMKRVKALHRYQVLQRIEAETERTHKLLESKAKQEERRRKANANLYIHRQTMLQQMEKLAISKRWRETLNDVDRAELEEAKHQRAAHKK